MVGRGTARRIQLARLLGERPAARWEFDTARQGEAGGCLARIRVNGTSCRKPQVLVSRTTIRKRNSSQQPFSRHSAWGGVFQGHTPRIVVREAIASRCIQVTPDGKNCPPPPNRVNHPGGFCQQQTVREIALDILGIPVRLILRQEPSRPSKPVEHVIHLTPWLPSRCLEVERERMSHPSRNRGAFHLGINPSAAMPSCQIGLEDVQEPAGHLANAGVDIDSTEHLLPLSQPSRSQVSLG